MPSLVKTSRSVALRQSPILQLALVSLFLFLLHVWLIAPVIQNGDGAAYNEQIERRILGERTTHIGYMLVGILFDALLPFDVERNLNLMCLLFAAVGGASLIAVARSEGAPFRTAVVAALLAFGLPPYLFGAVLAEVDVVACSLILLALAAWVHGRTVAAGLSFGAAMLVTPIVALSLPLFLFTRAEKPTGHRSLGHIKSLLLFAIAAGVIYLPFVGTFWGDYWHGGRGILHAPRQPWSMGDQVTRSISFFKEAAGPWMILAIVGLVLAIRNRRPLALGTIAAVTLTSIVGERFLDVPVQLPQLCLLTTFAALVTAAIPNRCAAAAILCIAWLGTAPKTYLQVKREVAARERLRATYLEMARQTPRLIVAGLQSSWDEGLPFERLVYHKTKLGLGIDAAQFTRLAPTISRRQRQYTIWLMASIDPRVMVVFERDWHRTNRTVLGEIYEVWIPNSAAVSN